MPSGDPLFMLAVRGRGAPERAGEVRRGCECRHGGVDSSGQPLGDLLQKPAIAVRVTEGRKRAVALPFRMPAAELRRSRRTGTVCHLAHVDATTNEFSARGLDVRY